MNVLNGKVSLACLGLLVLTLTVGCGGGAIDTEPVTGTVTLDGQPVEGVTVSFTPVESGTGNPGFAKTDASGVYQLQTMLGNADAGTTPGEYAVTLSKVEMVETGKTLPAADGTTTQEVESEEKLPAKYTKKETSGFTATVGPGANKFDFDLTSK